MLLRPLAGVVEDIGEFGLGSEGTGVAGLDDGAIGEGIAVGDADFDDIGAGLNKGIDELTRLIERRVTRSDKWNKGRAFAQTALLQHIIQQRHY